MFEIYFLVFIISTVLLISKYVTKNIDNKTDTPEDPFIKMYMEYGFITYKRNELKILKSKFIPPNKFEQKGTYEIIALNDKGAICKLINIYDDTFKLVVILGLKPLDKIDSINEFIELYYNKL